MSYLGPTAIKRLLSSGELKIRPYTPKRLEKGSYELSLGDEVFRTDSKKARKEKLNDADHVSIAPGQFALLLTEETLEIPKKNIAFISIKASIKLKGLINVSGFHVDPGFKGKLIFSVYNAGPSTIVLERSKPYFLIWIAQMSEEVKNGNDGKHDGQTNLKPEYIEALKSGKLASPNALSKRIDKINENFRYIILVLTIIITIATGIFIRQTTNSNEFKRGYEMAKDEVGRAEEVRKELKKYLKDSLSLYLIDVTKAVDTKDVNDK